MECEDWNTGRQKNDRSQAVDKSTCLGTIPQKSALQVI